MIVKISTFLGDSDHGQTVIPLYGPQGEVLEKVASCGLLPDVQSYIDGLRPRRDAQYVLVNALGAGEYYGCFPAGTLVETYSGEKPIESVEPGEQVRTHKNRFRSVVARVPKRAEELCDLYVQGLPGGVPALSATPNHELWVVTREDVTRTKRRVVWEGDTSTPTAHRRTQAMRELEFSWVPIAELRPGDRIAEPFPLEEDPAALGDEKWNCPEIAFLMGLYAAEGCVARRYDREYGRADSVIYVVSGEETGVVDRARNHAEKLGHGLLAYPSDFETSIRIQLCFAEFARLCEKHVGASAVEKKLSPALLRMPRGWQKVFLAAYSAGDGCVRKKGKGEVAQRITSASAALLRGVRLLLARNGIAASIRGGHNKKSSWYNGSPSYELSISGRDRGTPKSYIHPDGFILSSVKKVEQYGWEGEVYDLTVEEDSSFTASGVAVHNSNVNGDHFPESALIHAPNDWSGNPLLDKAKAKTWPYGYPTFYGAHPFCFPAGSVVTMRDRTRKPIDEIEVGEFVATKAGAKEVASVHVRDYDGEGIRLTLRGVSDELTATADHPVLIYRRAQVHCRHKYSKINQSVPGRRVHQDECVECREPVGDPVWVPIGEVDVGDYMLLPPPQHGDEKIPREFAELLGWVASEGYLGKEGLIQFSFSENNADDVTSVVRCLEANGLHVTRTPRPQDGLIMLSACSKALSAQLGEYIVGVKAEKRFTHKVLELDEASLCSMLGAYIDGAGHICVRGRNKGQLRIRSSSPAMLDILADVLRSVGVEATVHRDRDPGQLVPSPTHGKTYYDNGSGCVAVSASWLPDLLSKVRTRKHVMFSSGKSRKCDRVNGDVLVQVTYREEVHIAEKVYCLSVPGPEHYLVSDVVVHNSHHRNKDPSRAYGEVELAAWNDHMKRVELVVRVDFDKCQKFGGIGVWDKLKKGQFPDVSMGCLPAGSLITLANGLQKPIELVQETDWVLSHTGARRRVTDTMRYRHKGSIFRFNVYGVRRELVLTGNHPLWLVDGDQLRCNPFPKSVNKGRKQRHCTPFVEKESRGCVGCEVTPAYEFNWRRADEAQVGDYLAFPVPQQEDDTVKSRCLARFLGYYLAEGHVSNYNNRPLEQVNFSLSDEETDIADELESLARQLGADVMWHYERPEDGARYFSVVSKDLADKCLNWCGSGAKHKALSPETLYMPVPLLLEFLGAYLNGDGGTHKGACYFSTSSETLSHQLFIALARCGMIASVSKNDHKPSKTSVVKKDTTEYQVWVGTDFSWKLGPYTKKPVRRSKKVQGQRFFYEKDGAVFVMAPILDIVEEDYDADVFNFSVADEESYVAEGLAVHNSKVPFDTCSICLDRKRYRQALSTYNPARHRHPGQAVLDVHKKRPIRGVSITRADYCEHTRGMMNKILPDGRKVFVYNDFPRFFDISFVFIGADKTAKVMVYLAQHGQHSRTTEGLVSRSKPSEVAFAKTASAFVAQLQKKEAEIEKELPSNLPPSKAVPLMTAREKDIPDDDLAAMAALPLKESLSTATGLGMILRPREFTRLSSLRAARLGHDDELSSLHLDRDAFSPILASLLAHLVPGRSALGPVIERRTLIILCKEPKQVPSFPSLSSNQLRKIGSAYATYRQGIMDLIPHSQDLIEKVAGSSDHDLLKVASASVEEVFTPLAYEYLNTAFRDEAPFGGSSASVLEKSSQAEAGVERGLPSRNTW